MRPGDFNILLEHPSVEEFSKKQQAQMTFRSCDVIDIDSLMLKAHYLVECHIAEGTSVRLALSFAFDYACNYSTYEDLPINRYPTRDVLEGWLTGQAQARNCKRP